MKILTVVVLACLISSCSSSLPLSSLALSEKQNPPQNLKTVFSEKTSLVGIQPVSFADTAGDRAVLLISLLNRGTQAINFSIDDIRVFVDDSPHQLLSPERWQEELDTELEWNTATAVIASAAQSFNVTSVIAANAQTEGNIMSIRQSLKSANSRLQALQAGTINPNDWHRGHIVLDTLEDITLAHQLRIQINTAHENHQFLLRIENCHLNSNESVSNNRTRISRANLCWHY